VTASTAAVPAAPDQAAPDQARLQRAFVRGVAWSGAARWSAQAATWAATLVVARLLAPEDYGIVAMATVIHGFVMILSEFGVGVTIVTLRRLSPLQIAQFNALAVLLGTTGFAVMAALAPAIAAFFGRPVLVAVVVAMGSTFLVSGFRTIPSALLQRDLRFGALSAIEAIQAVVGAGVTLFGAWAGWGYWAIVAGVLGSSAAWTLMLVSTRPSSFAWPRRHVLGDALTFTRHQLTGSIAWYCYSNADFVVAGRMLGAHDLGIYTMAWTLARVVPERIANIAIRLTPAYFAVVSENPASLRTWIAGVAEGIALVCFPLLIGLSLVAGDALSVVVGPRWDAAVLPLRLLALYGAFDVVTQPLTRALVAVGDARFTARMGICLALIMPFGFVVGARYGPPGLAVAWLLIAPAVRLLALARVRRLIGLRLRDYAGALWPALSASAIMAGAIVLTAGFVQGHPAVVRLITMVLAGCVSYSAALLFVHRSRAQMWLDRYRRLRHA
jgi:teichuronic acid exporter